MDKKIVVEEYKRPFFKKIGDNFYEAKRKLTAKLVKRDKHFVVGTKGERLLFITMLLAIPTIHFLVFWFYVNIQSIVLAFQDTGTGAFTFQNFVTFWEQLTSRISNPIGEALKNTMLYFVEGLIRTPISIVIAFFFYKRICGYKAFRIIFYLPAIISAVAMTTAFSNFIDPSGPLGAIAKWFGKTLPPEGLLARSSTATWTILIYNFWTGFTSNVLLYGGAMARIPIEVIESAKLEGCGPFKEIGYITIPLIWPTMSTMLILSMTGILNSSGPILLFTEGEHGTSTLSFWIFQQVYGYGQYGGTGKYNLVSCTGLCFTLATVPLILLSRWLLEKVDTAEY